jgi:phosphoribosylformylglycinamidine cyclo-ligase
MANLYKESGVDIELGDKFVSKIRSLVGTTHNPSVLSGIGGFASLYKINSRQFLAASTDGVGTKVKLASAIQNHKYIGQDLVAMCVNDLICTGAKPLFFLDYFATGKLDLKVSTEVLASIVKACRSVDMALVGGETAEMPGVYVEGVYDLAGFAVGLVDKNKVLTGKKLKPEDRLIGLPSNGVHSNGYSLIRKLFDYNESKWMNLAIKPTRLYVKPFLKILNKYPHAIKGAAHITGSGFLNIPRINEGFDYKIEVRPRLPLILKEAVKRGNLDEENAFTTFNMGIGFVIAVGAKEEKMIITELKRLGEKPVSLGFATKGKGQVHLNFTPNKITLK